MLRRKVLLQLLARKDISLLNFCIFFGVWLNKKIERRITYYLIINMHVLWFFVDGAVAGAAAGVIVESALYPIDTIKTRLQAGWFYTNVIFLLISHWNAFRSSLMTLFNSIVPFLHAPFIFVSNIHLILKCGKLRLISSVYIHHLLVLMVFFVAVSDGGKIVWRGLYSGLAGNLAGVFP